MLLMLMWSHANLTIIPWDILKRGSDAERRRFPPLTLQKWKGVAGGITSGNYHALCMWMFHLDQHSEYVIWMGQMGQAKRESECLIFVLMHAYVPQLWACASLCQLRTVVCLTVILWVYLSEQMYSFLLHSCIPHVFTLLDNARIFSSARSSNVSGDTGGGGAGGGRFLLFLWPWSALKPELSK